MAVIEKLNLTEDQFRFFGEQVFQKFTQDNEESVPSWNDLFKEVDVINDGMSRVGADLIGDMLEHFKSLPVAAINQQVKENENALDVILKEYQSATGKGKSEVTQAYSIALCNYLKKLYRYKFKAKKPLFFGGSTKSKDAYKGLVFLWYIGCTNANEFYALYNQYANIKAQKAESDLNYLLGRENQWVEIPEAWDMTGTWRIEALESEVLHNDDKVVDVDLDKTKKVHQHKILYDYRFSYWGEVTIKPMAQKGFAKGKGVLSINAVPEHEKYRKWNLEFILSVRKSGSQFYINMDYEMQPVEEPEGERTFGYAILREPRAGRGTSLPYFHGYFLSNRMRFPINPDVADDTFNQSGIQISTGRATMYKKPS